MVVLLRSDMGEYGWLIPTQTESMIYPQYQSIVLFQSTRHSNLSNSSLNAKRSRGPVNYPCTEFRSPGQRVAKPKNLRIPISQLRYFLKSLTSPVAKSKYREPRLSLADPQGLSCGVLTAEGSERAREGRGPGRESMKAPVRKAS